MFVRYSEEDPSRLYTCEGVACDASGLGKKNTTYIYVYICVSLVVVKIERSGVQMVFQ